MHISFGHCYFCCFHVHNCLSSLKRTFFRRFSLSFGGFGNFAIRWSAYPHLKHFQGVCSLCLLSEALAARAFSFSCLILLKHFSEEWLVTPQKVHFVWTVFDLSLFIPKPDLLSRFRQSVCKDEMFNDFRSLIFPFSP